VHTLNRLACALLLAFLAACAGPAADQPRSVPTRPIVSPDTISSIDGSPVTGEVPSAMLDAIVADAAAQTGIDEAEIEVIRAEQVTWNDGSLGCPEPGMLYTQALVEGYHVVLDVDGEELDYRADAAGRFRICENPDRSGG
jgi:hypothetical protein